jgi:hypothetical protein
MPEAPPAASTQVVLSSPWVVARERPETVSDLLTRIDGDTRFADP